MVIRLDNQTRHSILDYHFASNSFAISSKGQYQFDDIPLDVGSQISIKRYVIGLTSSILLDYQLLALFHAVLCYAMHPQHYTSGSTNRCTLQHFTNGSIDSPKCPPALYQWQYGHCNTHPVRIPGYKEYFPHAPECHKRRLMGGVY